ncbi:hypothetical protein AB0P07_24900 [Streptomyces sp. NPDC085944]|uniref:hypothetical protein n=1 Tax=Streptomyces sp. NPDC085944 TaxID=3154962 RepID=UPI003420554B
MYRTGDLVARRQDGNLTYLGRNAVLAAAVTLTAGWLAFEGRINIGELIMAVGLAQFIMEPPTGCSSWTTASSPPRTRTGACRPPTSSTAWQ